MELGDRLREARTRNGWTQTQVEAWAEIPGGALANYETGRREPGAKVLRRLAQGLRVSSDWLLGLEPGESA